ncbi:MAG: biotin transporter BioY [Actinomycetia bacterium]|nr:biotin transporter BioY [Actinomycetes bacterium]
MSLKGFDPARDLGLVAVFAALIVAMSYVSIGIGPVPITLQTLAVSLCGLVLGPWRGGAAVLLYLLAGIANLPVFAGGRTGLVVLEGPSAGYLIAFPIAAFLAGLFAIQARRIGRWLPVTLALLALLANVFVVHPAGIIGLMVNADMSFGAAFGVDIVFWPGDVVKSVLAGLIAAAVHRAFPSLLPRPVQVAQADR